MNHQWYNLKEFGDKEKELLEAVNAVVTEEEKIYGYNGNFEERMARLENAYNSFVKYCKEGVAKDNAKFSQGEREM